MAKTTYIVDVRAKKTKENTYRAWITLGVVQQNPENVDIVDSKEVTITTKRVLPAHTDIACEHKLIAAVIYDSITNLLV